jgi:1-acyl-sn-glycerol-3-phosphate acyltransferase
MFYVRLFTAVIGFVVAGVYGIGLALVRRDRSRVAYDYAQLLGRLTQRPLGVRRVEVQDYDNLRRESPCIYIANHQSVFDVVVLASVYPLGTAVIAKQEIRSVPFFGWLYLRTGNILIDRSDRTQAISELKAASAEIRRRGVSVWIFPEGTRGKRAGELLSFKKGAFQMAIAARCPLVPVVMSPLRTVIDTPARRIRPGTVGIRILSPIPTAGLTENDVEALIAEAHQRMADTLRELALEYGLPPSAGLALPERAPG